MIFENKIRKTFLKLDEVKSADFYGSIHAGKNDAYSDIDIVLEIDNHVHFYENFPNNLKKIDDYFVIFPVVTEKSPQVFTIVWKNISLYKKLDIRIYSRATKEFIGTAINFDEDKRQFYDQFIGALRFAKYIRRGDYNSAKKFYESLSKIVVNPIIKPRHDLYKTQRSVGKLTNLYIEMLESYIKIYSKIDHKFATCVIEFLRNEFK